jgi:hypothetical protein
MNLFLKRQVKTSDFTLGELFIDGISFCQTVEDMERMEGEKVWGKTAIPKGTYKVIVNTSNRFKKEMPLLLDVKNYEGVRIHAGNTAEDSHGCIIVGMVRTLNGVGMSRVAYQKLMDRLKGVHDIVITIE